MKQQPLAAFIIVCWNNKDLLAECFESIKEQSYEHHVTIMIDNGSADDSVAFTKDNYPWVDIVEAGANLGFAKGNNVALDYAMQKYPDLAYAVFLNTDARMRADWLKVMVDFAERKPTGALFQSTTLDYYDHEIIDSTHIYISRAGTGTQARWRTIYKGEAGPKRVFGVNAAVALISRRFIDAQPFNRLFDERMFMYLEDVDLSARATIMGWDNYLVPGTVAYHMGSASSGKKPGFSLYMTYRNNIAMLCKNIPASLIFRMLPSILRSDYHTMRHLKRHGNGDVIPKLLKGRFIGLLRLPLYVPSIWKMRQYRRKMSTDYLWQLMHSGE